MMKYPERQRGTIYLLVVIALFPLLAMADDHGLDSDEVIERVLWKNTPIAINLYVGKERVVRFPESVSVGVPQGLALLLRSQSINGTIYLKAHLMYHRGIRVLSPRLTAQRLYQNYKIPLR